MASWIARGVDYALIGRRHDAPDALIVVLSSCVVVKNDLLLYWTMLSNRSGARVDVQYPFSTRRHRKLAATSYAGSWTMARAAEKGVFVFVLSRPIHFGRPGK